MSRYITTTLPYINADPHLGHALEFVEADFFARVMRQNGEDIFLNIGTDEHGAKIAEKAKQKGNSPQEYAEEYSIRFKVFAKQLNISHNSFVRTTDTAHKMAAQEFWKRSEKAGDIYKAKYEIKYCIGCELEKTGSELSDGRCPLHTNLEIEIRKEENYYFRFSKYQDALLKHYEEHPSFVVPKGRMNEIKSFVSAGLKDFSISRRKEKLSWGVSVPGDEAHVMYVWFDALTNYISAIGWPNDDTTFNKWWPVTHFAGKDNLRQQSAMWQAMLLSVGLPFSKQVFIHGFITSGGKKMSKSLGNVIDPLSLVQTYGADALRYILLRHSNPFEDSDITLESIREYYTAHLTNGLGNLVARVMKLSEEYLETPIKLLEEDKTLSSEFVGYVNEFKFNEAMDYVFLMVSNSDSYMTENMPYKYIKSDDLKDSTKARCDIAFLVQQLARIAIHLASAMPSTSERILKAIYENKKPENIFPRL